MPSRAVNTVTNIETNIKTLNEKINTLEIFLNSLKEDQKNLEDKLFKKYTDSDAISAMGITNNNNPLNHDKYLDSEAIIAINSDNKYVKKDGSQILTSDWDIGDTRKILGDEIRARDGAGLKLYDDAGNGLFIKDGGNLGIGITTPLRNLHLHGRDHTSYFKLTNTTTGIGNLDGFDFTLWNNHVSLINREAGPMKFRTSNIERLAISSGGNIGIGNITATTKLDIDSDILRLRTAKTPASAGAAGNQGDWCWDATYIYVCTATNTWKRVAIAAW